MKDGLSCELGATSFLLSGLMSTCGLVAGSLSSSSHSGAAAWAVVDIELEMEPGSGAAGNWLAARGSATEKLRTLDLLNDAIKKI